MCQILEDYSELSLKAQDYKVPPSQVPLLLQKVKNHLQDLSTSWEWGERELKLAGIGAPVKIIEELKVGQFTPFITKFIQQHHMRRLNAQ